MESLASSRMPLLLETMGYDSAQGFFPRSSIVEQAMDADALGKVLSRAEVHGGDNNWAGYRIFDLVRVRCGTTQTAEGSFL